MTGGETRVPTAEQSQVEVSSPLPRPPSFDSQPKSHVAGAEPESDRPRCQHLLSRQRRRPVPGSFQGLLLQLQTRVTCQAVAALVPKTIFVQATPKGHLQRYARAGKTAPIRGALFAQLLGAAAKALSRVPSLAGTFSSPR